jgi:hypothetical protein
MTMLILGFLLLIIIFIKRKFFPVSEEEWANIDELKEKYCIPENVTAHGKKKPEYCLKPKNAFSQVEYRDFRTYPNLTEKEKLRVYTDKD